LRLVKQADNVFDFAKVCLDSNGFAALIFNSGNDIVSRILMTAVVDNLP
jgi:hypothetical protein